MQPYIRETFPVGLLGCNCTLLGDLRTREAMVVDPGLEEAGGGSHLLGRL